MTDMARAPRASAWKDLADNQPGQRVRAQADALYAHWRGRPLLRRLASSRRAERAVRRDAEGERQVARHLAKLGPGWQVLHGIPVGCRGIVDHLVIGPGGVFIVDSRHRADATVWLGGDTLMVDGQRVHHVRDSRHDAAEVSALLSAAVGFEVPVACLVVVVGDKRFDVGHQSEDCPVRVTTPQAAVRWLRRRGTEWTSYGTDRIYAMARRSTTWTEPPVSSTTGVLEETDRVAPAANQADERAAS